MKDRFVLVGALALLLAVVSSVWLLASRSPAAAIQTESSTAADSIPTTVSAVIPKAAAGTTVDLVVVLDGLGGAGAFAGPGDRVDVLAFIPGELNEGNAMTRVLLPDVVVLQGSTNAGPSDTALTVGVSPEQAVLVRSAQSLGVRMFAEMRSADTSIAAQSPASVSEHDIRSRLPTRS
jgi:Flp pilus assembly protein CpaB